MGSQYHAEKKGDSKQDEWEVCLQRYEARMNKGVAGIFSEKCYQFRKYLLEKSHHDHC